MQFFKMNTCLATSLQQHQSFGDTFSSQSDSFLTDQICFSPGLAAFYQSFPLERLAPLALQELEILSNMGPKKGKEFLEV